MKVGGLKKLDTLLGMLNLTIGSAFWSDILVIRRDSVPFSRVAGGVAPVLAMLLTGLPVAAQQAAYTVQVGAFRERGAAEVLDERLQSQGFEPRVVHVGTDPLLLVRVGRFGDRRAAERMASRTRAAGFPGTVIDDAVRERPFGTGVRPSSTDPVVLGTPVAPALQPTDSALARAPRRVARSRPRLSFETTMSSVFDSNINHDSASIDSYGFVAGTGARFRTRSSRPAIQLDYGLALHSYTQTDKWDRVSQLGRAAVDMPVASWLSLGLTAQASLKGSSEDREIGDQYAFLPRLELRPNRDIRIRLTTAYRKRHFGEASGSNSTNRYVAVNSYVNLGNGTLETAARFEKNEPERPRNRFERQTYTTRYITPLSKRDELLVGLEYSPRRYPERLVDVDEDREEPRLDRKWAPELRWVRTWRRTFRTELEYEFETRFSNDPEKGYRGHVLTLTTAIPW